MSRNERANESRLEHVLDPLAINLLNQITDATDAVLVISSTWRILTPIEDFRSIFKKLKVHGVVYDVTPRFGGKHRGVEIQSWLDSHPEVTSWVILDDDSDMDHLMPWLLKTSMARGLRTIHVERAIRMLGVSDVKR